MQAPEVHTRAVGKRRWMWSTANEDKQNEKLAGVFHHGAKRASGPGVGEADLAGGPGKGAAAAPDQQGRLQISNAMSEFQQCLVPCTRLSSLKKYKQKNKTVTVPLILLNLV